VQKACRIDPAGAKKLSGFSSDPALRKRRMARAENGLSVKKPLGSYCINHYLRPVTNQPIHWL
jgi:hypothetical protein